MARRGRPGPPPADPTLERARRAVAVVFWANGLQFASWASRTPATRDALGLGPAGLGLLVTCVSVGALTALPLSGGLVARLGAGRSVRGAVLVSAAGLGLTALGVLLGTVAVAAPGFMLIGLGSGTWDVAMNVEGTDVERRLGRTLLPRFHAGFSLGTVTGAGSGAACAALGVSAQAQFAATALVTVGVVLVALRDFGAARAPRPGDAAHASAAGAWRERRTLLIGLMVLSFALGEGIANDWLAIAVVDGYGRSDAVGALTFALFVVAMTLGRLVAAGPLERFGRVRVLRGLAGAVAVGTVGVVVAPSAGWAAVGAVVWGLGSSLGFPVGLGAATDEEHMAPVRVSVVSSVGYTAFLAGPALVGGLASRFGILDALLVVPLAMVAACAVAGAARPLVTASPSAARVAQPKAGSSHQG